MTSGFTDLDWWQRWLLAYGVLTMRYIIFAGLAFLIFYVWKKRAWMHKKIQQKYPESKRIWFEIKYSLFSFVIFASFACLSYYFTLKGWNKVYIHFEEYSTAYAIFSFICFIFIHDTYFYWTHRLMHHPLLFERIHKTHHMSHNPTPFAAFSFHPLEAIIEFGILFVVTFLLPVHRYVILAFSIYMIINNVLGHLGYELYPKGFTKNKFTSWLNTSTNHNMHHKYVNCNYGLYFSIWDTIMDTHHSKYHETFESISSRKEAKQIEVTEPQTATA